ncbi:hypothetical protein MKX03_026109 [Papaver bracteatum]|nr:hypothetical protein MKX03_026109 [Papaver bracteatum]
MILLICLFTLLTSCSSQLSHNLTVMTSGDYRIISEAVEASPSLRILPYVIHIRKWNYKENVLIPQNKKNLVFRGEGMLTTKIIVYWSNASGFGTQDSATLILLGDGFMARDISIVNTAGPNGHQVVTLTTEADRCVFYIKPNQGQSITIKTDGRDNLKINTGIILHNCNILATQGLERVKKYFSSYFGRPWRSYSTTVVMQSFVGDFISREGWLPWSKDDNKTLSTLTYIEYGNRGPGAKIKGRVNWRGFKVYNNSKCWNYNSYIIFKIIFFYI